MMEGAKYIKETFTNKIEISAQKYLKDFYRTGVRVYRK